jgi:hypothetical protein
VNWLEVATGITLGGAGAALAIWLTARRDPRDRQKAELYAAIAELDEQIATETNFDQWRGISRKRNDLMLMLQRIEREQGL